MRAHVVEHPNLGVGSIKDEYRAVLADLYVDNVAEYVSSITGNAANEREGSQLQLGDNV